MMGSRKASGSDCTLSGVNEFGSTASVARPGTAGMFSLNRSLSRDTNRDPTTAEPTVAPTWRKKLLDAVAVPTIRWENEFCTISTRICMLSPIPAPNTAR